MLAVRVLWFGGLSLSDLRRHGEVLPSRVVQAATIQVSKTTFCIGSTVLVLNRRGGSQKRSFRCGSDVSSVFGLLVPALLFFGLSSNSRAI